MYFSLDFMEKQKFDDYGNSVVNDVGSVFFKCPVCHKEEIVRSRKARVLVKPYKCNSCNFVGP